MPAASAAAGGRREFRSAKELPGRREVSAGNGRFHDQAPWRVGCFAEGSREFRRNFFVVRNFCGEHFFEFFSCVGRPFGLIVQAELNVALSVRGGKRLAAPKALRELTGAKPAPPFSRINIIGACAFGLGPQSRAIDAASGLGDVRLSVGKDDQHAAHL